MLHGRQRERHPWRVRRSSSRSPLTENYLRGSGPVRSQRRELQVRLLAKSVLELAADGEEEVPREARRPVRCRDLQPSAGRTSPGHVALSRFLDTCRQFNEGAATEAQLHDATVRLGFNNVIDAFHVVGSGDIPVRFFMDERNTSLRGIRLTSPLLGLAGVPAQQALAETEMRWRLVETAVARDQQFADRLRR